MAFPPLGISDHVVVSVSIDFPKNYSCADWDGLCDHLRNVPWKDIFNFSASAAASELFEGVQLGIDVYVYIPHCKYQVKPCSSPWFSETCATAIVHFFQL